MLELLRDLVLKVVAIVAPFAVAWFYKPERIAADLKIRVRGHGDGVSFEGGELPKTRIWFLVSNLSPFRVEIDRLVIQVAYGAVIGEIAHVKKHSIAASREAEFLVEASINEYQIAYIRKNLSQKPQTELCVTAFVTSKLHDFETTSNVSTNNVRLLNVAV
jgi:hypothetical protein